MSDKQWYVAVDGQSFGPFSEGDLRAKFQAGEYTGQNHVFTEGMKGWIPAESVDEFSATASAAPAPPPPAPNTGRADVIDFKIHGTEMQFVEIELDPGESVVAEAGGMMYMENGIEMNTIFGDGGGQDGGFMDKLVGAGKL